MIYIHFVVSQKNNNRSGFMHVLVVETTLTKINKAIQCKMSEQYLSCKQRKLNSVLMFTFGYPYLIILENIQGL